MTSTDAALVHQIIGFLMADEGQKTASDLAGGSTMNALDALPNLESLATHVMLSLQCSD